MCFFISCVYVFTDQISELCFVKKKKKKKSQMMDKLVEEYYCQDCKYSGE